MVSEDNLKVAVGVVATIIVISIIYMMKSDSEGMFPNYNWDSSGNVINPGFTLWQSTTQGGIPNSIVGKLPDGQTIGKYDYLGGNYTGLNLIPGSFQSKDYYYAGYPDCGCGCGGQKKAQGVVGSTESYIGRPSTRAIPNFSKSVSTAQALLTGTDRSPLNFANAPLDPSNLCQKGISGTKNGRCSKNSGRNGIFGVRVENFGNNQDSLAQTVATVGNSNRAVSSNGGYYSGIPLQSSALKYTDNLREADAAFRSAIVANNAMAATAASVAMQKQIQDQAPINAFQDSPTNSPRRAISQPSLGITLGWSESAFDGRHR